MTKYSRFERRIADILNNNPKIKNKIKKNYQRINYIIHKKNYKINLNENLDIERINIDDQGSFFGYYDKSPLKDNNIIYHSFDNNPDNRKNDYINIILNYSVVDNVNSWNWQQGARLQWINNQEFIYNFFDGETYRSKKYNIKTHKKIIYKKPIYDVSKSGKFALTLNFSNLAKLRPDYGYFNKSYKDLKINYKNDGIYFINLDTGEDKLIISLEELINLNYKKTMDNAQHKVNHIMISPNDKRFMFLHRWYDSKGIKYSRLITSDANGENLFILSDDDMVSHCNWKSDDEIIGWMRKQKFGDHYYLLKDKTANYEIIGENILNEDGHPTISNNGRYLLTDTYPDKSRMSHLILYDMKDKKQINIGEFFSPLKYYGEKRCDLHPRFSPDNKSITFDSVHEGKRYLYLIKNLDKIALL